MPRNSDEKKVNVALALFRDLSKNRVALNWSCAFYITGAGPIPGRYSIGQSRLGRDSTVVIHYQ
jgi:hypothetical protein